MCKRKHRPSTRLTARTIARGFFTSCVGENQLAAAIERAIQAAVRQALARKKARST
jgi:hypothetical protein